MLTLNRLLIAVCLLLGSPVSAAIGAAENPTTGQLIGLCYRDGTKDIVLEEVLKTEGVPYVRLQQLSGLAGSGLKGLVLGEGFDDSAGEIKTFVEKGGALLSLKPSGRVAEALGLKQVGAQKNGYLAVRGKGASLISYEGRFQLFGQSSCYEGGENLASLSPEERFGGIIRVKRGAGTALVVAFDLPTTMLQLLQPESECGKTVDVSNVEYDLGDAPQVDLMRRLLVGLFLERLDVPIMRKWYFPSLHKALLVPTGDQDGIGFDAMKVALDLIKELGTPYTFYVTPTMQPMTKEQFKVLVDGGMEIGLHPDLAHGNHPFTEQELDIQLKKAEADVGIRMTGLRTHSGRWGTVRDVPLWAERAGLQYDSDLGIKWWESKPPKDGYWVGTGLPYNFIDPKDYRRLDLLEIPERMSDNHYFWKPHKYIIRYTPGVINWGKSGHDKTFFTGLGLGEDSAFALFKPFLDQDVEKYYETYCYGWHPCYLAARKLNMKEDPYYRTDAHFRKAVNYARSRGIGLIGANALNDFWRAREKVSLKDIVWSPESATERCQVSSGTQVKSLTFIVPLWFHGKRARVSVDGHPQSCTQVDLFGGQNSMFAVDLGPKELVIAVQYD